MSRTIIITGGTRGIGAAIARTFHQAGDTVLLAGRHDSGLAATLGARAHFLAADVRRRADHQALVARALALTGRLDVYVNCAGVSIWRPCLEVDEAFLDELIDTNAKGLFWGCQAAGAHFIGARQPGAIVNISSLAGKRGSANNSVYCASKFAVNGITQALAKEFGPHGVRVNAVCPVYIVTDFLRQQLADPRSPAGGRPVDDYLADFARGQAALQRLPTAQEVADLTAYLASPAASGVTGQCINLDCGVLPS
jgi:3-oxoacyl-[acyl-carrier protein] reductase/meso-butanediol dehydrogenase/(S,S)-butanediol dehydrogenase/diacetyl reductase